MTYMVCYDEVKEIMRDGLPRTVYDLADINHIDYASNHRVVKLLVAEGFLRESHREQGSVDKIFYVVNDESS